MNTKKGKLIFVAILLLVVILFSPVELKSAAAQSAPKDDDPEAVLLFRHGCRSEIMAPAWTPETKGRGVLNLICYKADGVTVDWSYDLCGPLDDGFFKLLESSWGKPVPSCWQKPPPYPEPPPYP